MYRWAWGQGALLLGIKGGGKGKGGGKRGKGGGFVLQHPVLGSAALGPCPKECGIQPWPHFQGMKDSLSQRMWIPHHSLSQGMQDSTSPIPATPASPPCPSHLPDPSPDLSPSPDPDPDPSPDPNPSPDPDPDPDLDLNPNPDPSPDSDPNPDLDPSPDPDPSPGLSGLGSPGWVQEPFPL